MNDLEKIITKALKSFSAGARAVEAVSWIDGELVFGGRQKVVEGKVHILTMGKAGMNMAVSLRKSLLAGGCPLGKVICFTKHHHGYEAEGVECFEGGHPVPDKHSFLNGKLLKETLASFHESDTLLLGITGGGSSTIELPLESVSDELVMDINRTLINSGAPIEDVNLLRAQLSRVKNGGLPLLTSCRSIIGLCLCDVPSGMSKDVSSGPLDPQPVRREILLELAGHYLNQNQRKSFQAVLESSGWKKWKDSKDGYPWSRVNNVIIGDARSFLENLKDELAGDVRLSDCPLSCSFEKGLDFLMEEFQREPGRPLLSGGEFPVAVDKGSHGSGGRNSHFALACGLKMMELGMSDFYVVSFGTDGDDGNTSRAGAWLNGEKLQEAIRSGLDPRKYLESNDSGTFFQKLGTDIAGRVTHTNVMDCRLMGRGPFTWSRK